MSDELKALWERAKANKFQANETDGCYEDVHHWLSHPPATQKQYAQAAVSDALEVLMHVMHRCARNGMTLVEFQELMRAKMGML